MSASKGSRSQTVLSGLATSVLPENLLDMSIPGAVLTC